MIIDHGHVVASGRPADLAAAAGSDTVISFRPPHDTAAEDLPNVGYDRRISGNLVEFRTTSATADVAALSSWALGRGIEFEELALARPSLEDIYLDLVGEGESPEVVA